MAIPPAPTRWVTDTAGFISEPTRAALDARLEAYQRQTGHQVVVWIGKTIEGADLADWAVHTFEAWKVGRKGFDDGLVMFILAEDHKIDIEVGYGLEDRVADALAGRIINEVMVPRVRAGDPDGAVKDGVEAILTTIEGQPVPELQQRSPPPPPRGGGGSRGALPLLIVVGLFIALAIFSPRTAMWLLYVLSSGRGGGGFGGGGFGGGGFGGGGGGGGGFSGGGGRSGGGGAQGGW